MERYGKIYVTRNVNGCFENLGRDEKVRRNTYM